MFVDTLKEVDDGGYHFFYQITQQVPAVVPVMRMGDWLGTYLAACVLLLLVIVLFLRGQRNGAAFVSLAVFLLGVFFVEVVCRLVEAPRPSNAETQVDAMEMTRSFPARGVLMFAMTAVLLHVAIWTSGKRLALQLLLTAAVPLLVSWVAVSQLALGLHFVTDVVGGLAGGAALGLLATRFLPRTRQHASSSELDT
jgi:membrane-associated phospholipid phosphatase